MKKINTINIVAAIIIALTFTFAMNALAADKLLNAKVQSVTEGMSKNGSPYVRVIVEEQRELQGVKYVAGVPAMAFGPLAEKAKALKAGATLKAVVTEREWNGSTSYTIVAILGQ